MKYLTLLAFLMGFGIVQAQIPNGYYDGAEGLTGYALKSELSTITGQGYISHSYGDLWDAFVQTDDDVYYEDDGTVLDIYSENPDGTDPYEFTFISNQCGNYSEEGDCYNREHLVPQSWFNEDYPMKADIHHIYPTDGYVNNRRGNLPFGEVANADWTSDNGSKKGPDSYNYPTAYQGEVFEPIDEFKGDIARVYFYMATRYEDQVGSWQYSSTTSQQVFNGTSDQVFTDWFLDMLLTWNAEDPVSQREIDRNNAAYVFQGNRNPFIDHPEYAEMIWGDGQGESYIINEQFNDCATIPTNFTVVSEMSAIDWTCTTQFGVNDSGAMQMNSYSDGQQVPSIDWLITTNPINFDNFIDEKLAFYAASTFGNTDLQLLYSADYNGNGNPSDFDWQPVPNIDIPLYPAGGTGEVQNTFSDVDISAIAGSAVYLAFKYDTSNGEEATRWTVDNFELTGTPDMGVAPQHKLACMVYPNPVPNGGRFSVQIAGKANFSYAVYNLMGQLIEQGKGQNGRHTISAARLSAGIYLIKISSNGQSTFKKVVVE